MELFAGIDVGTSTLKILVVDKKGHVVALSQKSYSVIIESVGHAEQHPDDWCRALDEALIDINNQCDSSNIVSIGFSGQMHGMVLVDENLKLIRPAIIWMDQRTEAQCIEIKQAINELKLEPSLLNSPTPGMMIVSLVWLKEHEPQNFARIYKVMSPKDYVRLYLTGEVATDQTDASATLAYFVKGGQWSNALINHLAIDTSILPDVKLSTENGGILKSVWAKRYGLSTEVYIAVGGGDSAMQLIGNGILESGIATINIGTASQMATVISQPDYDAKGRLQTWCHGKENSWYIQGGSLNGGSILKWFKTNILETDIDYDGLSVRAATAGVGADGLLFLPYLAGERSPYNNPKARAAFVGLTLKHSVSDMIRAMMEGVVYNLKGVYEIYNEMGIEVQKMIASGGGASSEIWRQIQADILGVPIYTTIVNEEASLGAIIVGAVGAGYYKDLSNACLQMVQLSEHITMPNLDNQLIYNTQYEKFKVLYAATNN